MMYEKRTLSPRITLNGKLHSITISKDVVRLLGLPSHVCIMRNLDGRSLAVRPCDEKEYLSLEVPEFESWKRNKHLRIYSTEFVREFLVHNGCDESETLTMPGEYDPKNNAVIFQKIPENTTK
ncbi:MAG: hypothetical protein IKF90_09970 [Parasporobacterium sp.]|nr:hypothetical protein [Parasporobacterium sp.]